MNYHGAAFFLGFLLDLAFGDPYFLPHPVRLIGKLILWLERKLRGEEKAGKSRPKEQTGRDLAKSEQTSQNQTRCDPAEEFQQGMILVVVVLVSVMAAVALLLLAAYLLHPYVGMALETILTYQILAVKSLKTESMKVYEHLVEQDLEQARTALSMIVGRDTDCLEEEEIIKAAVETVAENTSDGVIAPMLYTAIGGPVLGLAYKAVNTMDSMVGYKNKRYLYFGRAAAKLDDLVNYIPSRISAFLMIAVSFEAGKGYSGKRAFKIYKRDRQKHTSPNSAQTESVCAGALGIRLGGDHRYSGKIVRKPMIGDEIRKAEYEDIPRTNHLMYITAWLCEIICLLILL